MWWVVLGGKNGGLTCLGRSGRLAGGDASIRGEQNKLQHNTRTAEISRGPKMGQDDLANRASCGTDARNESDQVTRAVTRPSALGELALFRCREFDIL
jgi:hypothetical protein